MSQDARAREMERMAVEITSMRDLLIDLWHYERPANPTFRGERLWARVEAIATEGDYGWVSNDKAPVEALERRIAVIEEILRRVTVTQTREV